MEAEAALPRYGGVATRGQLLELTTRRRLDRALAEGRVERRGRGNYVLPSASEAVRRAADLSGVVGLRSAALQLGWPVKVPPPVPEVVVPSDRSPDPARRDGVRLLWSDLAEDMVEGGVTTPERTLVDCARRLPFDEALAVFDSALRCGDVEGGRLRTLAVRGPGAEALRRLQQYADARAANPFESVLRAMAIEAGLEVEPQAAVRLGADIVHPDLVDRGRRLVLEADSWTWHASRRAHRRDCARYNLLVVHGWQVLRFTWEQVMHRPSYVAWVLRQARQVGPEELHGGREIPA